MPTKMPQPRRVWFQAVLFLLCLCALVWTFRSGAAEEQSRILYDQKSAFNRIIVREQPDGVRELVFEDGGAIQSAFDPAHPDALVLSYTRTIMTALAVVPHPQRICIIGLGGGSMARFLHRRFPDARIDAVELDPAVVDVARRFFDFREDEHLKAHVGDGRAFIEKSVERYDIIFLDAYGPDSIPYSLATREFLDAVKQRLTPGGVVAANIWGPEHNALYNDMIRTYRDIYPQVHIVRTEERSNRAVLALMRAAPLSQADLASAAAEFCRQTNFPYDLAQFINLGYEPPPTDIDAARILRDADAPKD